MDVKLRSEKDATVGKAGDGGGDGGGEEALVTNVWLCWTVILHRPRCRQHPVL